MPSILFWKITGTEYGDSSHLVCMGCVQEKQKFEDTSFVKRERESNRKEKNTRQREEKERKQQREGEEERNKQREGEEERKQQREGEKERKQQRGNTTKGVEVEEVYVIKEEEKEVVEEGEKALSLCRAVQPYD